MQFYCKLDERPVDDNRSFDYEIEIKDTDPELFLQMLKYLCTGDVIYERDESSHFLKNAIELYSIADKYLLDEFRDQTEKYIISSMTIENAAAIHFKSAYRWPELKKKVKQFVADNFAAIIKTPCYEHIVKNRDEYPAFFEINTEILMNPHKKELADYD
ncbi:705_t:CDS:1 [Ambispora leptoticha]|uniref:705_t:CDS:1 n=1 Tax=Ambispora leptoticha TaxID=144679 RepID=A0A9N9GPQ8_9GLOM|nr:705_t:CDS:1 [Ambispora leptoticha]